MNNKQRQLSSARKKFNKKNANKKENIPKKKERNIKLKVNNFFGFNKSKQKEINNENDSVQQKTERTNETKNKRRLANNDNIYDIKVNEVKTCLVCGEILSLKDIQNNKLNCKHLFCFDCIFEYLKEKINNNQFLEIHCLQKDCNKILDSNIVVKFLIKDKPLLEKYNKLIKRNQLKLDPNIQLCPFPDCESYAKKKKNDKYVKCIHNKHKFCFNCLKDWHGTSPCQNNSLNNSLTVLENSDTVKRCPKCKFYIELRDGCNHMTCSNCRYEFCWLCLDKYTSGHFNKGRCKGLQYAKHKRTCCRTIIDIYLLRFLLIFLKSLAFGIVAPYLIIFRIYFKIYDDCINIRNEFSMVLLCISGNLACLALTAPLTSITCFIAILMIFIWPLNDCLFDLVFCS